MIRFEIVILGYTQILLVILGVKQNVLSVSYQVIQCFLCVTFLPVCVVFCSCPKVSFRDCKWRPKMAFLPLLLCICSMLLLPSCMLGHGNSLFVQGANKNVRRNFTQKAFSASDGDGYGGNGFTVSPLVAENTATVIILHGLGGNGHEWGYLAVVIAILDLNYCKFILPSADSATVSYLGDAVMPSWFDIYAVREDAKEDKVGLLKSSKRIEKIIQAEIANGVPSTRIFVVGFSQGGALATTVFLRSPVKLAGMIGISTWAPLSRSYPSELSNATANSPILYMNGMQDSAVPISLAEQSVRLLRKMKRQVNFIKYPDLGHILVDKTVIAHVENFIKKYAPGRTGVLQDAIDKFAKLLSPPKLMSSM